MEILHASDFESPIGRMRAVSGDRGLAYLELPHASGRGFRGWLERHAAGARVEEGFAPNRTCITQILEFLESKRVEFDLELDLRGTPFQLEVYAALADIPYGESLSYTELARRVGRPRAVRAVGAANGSNPLPLVIPCHRVIGRRGTLQGYAGGVELKARLLAMESRGSLV